MAWQSYYGKAPSGIVCGDFVGKGTNDLALLLFKTTSEGKTQNLPSVPADIDVGSKSYDPALQVKVLLFADHHRAAAPIYLLSGPAPYLPVLRRKGPGFYEDAYNDAASFRADHDVVLFEQLDSGVTAFYVVNGAIKRAVVSD